MRSVHDKKEERKSVRAVGKRESWERERESEIGGSRGREKKSEGKKLGLGSRVYIIFTCFLN